MLMLGKIVSRRKGQQRMRWLGSITDSVDVNLSKFLEIVKAWKEAWHPGLGSCGRTGTIRTAALFQGIEVYHTVAFMWENGVGLAWFCGFGLMFLGIISCSRQLFYRA